jgi:iron(III) transport system ATP-binding protein
LQTVPSKWLEDTDNESPRASGEDRNPVLDLQAITHYFGDLRAVDDVSLQVHPGEVVCLLGPSGCGKSTLLRVAAALEELQHGKVCIDGRDMRTRSGRAVPPEQRNVGLMFQDSALFPHLSVLENVAFGLDPLPAKKRRARALEMLDQLGVKRFSDRFPHRLSGGQQQRVALARALAPAPRLMLLDEPFSALDARLRGRIRDDTLHLLKQAGAGTLLVTHDPEEAMFMADRIALMRDGRILQFGTPVELYCNPVSPFVASFFGDVNRLEGTVREGFVETAIGRFAADELADGQAASVLIRPEAIDVRVAGPADPGHGQSHVVMSRLLGRSSLVHLCVHDPENREHHLHSSMPGVFLPGEDQPVELHVDSSRAFVYPADAD